MKKSLIRTSGPILMRGKPLFSLGPLFSSKKVNGEKISLYNEGMKGVVKFLFLCERKTEFAGAYPVKCIRAANSGIGVWALVFK